MHFAQALAFSSAPSRSGVETEAADETEAAGERQFPGAGDRPKLPGEEGGEGVSPGMTDAAVCFTSRVQLLRLVQGTEPDPELLRPGF